MKIKTMKTVLSIAVAALLAHAAQAADAVTRYWVGGTGSEESFLDYCGSANWNPAKAPQNSDQLYFTNTAYVVLKKSTNPSSGFFYNYVFVQNDSSLTFSSTWEGTMYSYVINNLTLSDTSRFRMAGCHLASRNKSPTLSDVEIVGGTSNVVEISSSYIKSWTLSKVTGAGVLELRVQAGAKMTLSDISGFTGTLISSVSSSYNGYEYIMTGAPGADIIIPENNYMKLDAAAEYAFGTLTGGGTVRGKYTKLTLGKGDDFDANVTMESAKDVEKVGAGTMNYELSGCANLLVSAGAVALTNSTRLPSGNITLAGGALCDKGDAALADVSAKIADSTSAITIDIANNATFATTLDDSNTAGLTKKGAGTLSLAKGQTLNGPLVVEGGKIGLASALSGDAETLFTWTTAGSSVTLEDFALTVEAPLALALVPNAEAGTTSLVVERSVMVFTWTGAEDGRWENAANWTVGGAATEFYPGADDTVEIALANQTIAISTNVAFGTFKTLDATTRFSVLFTGEGQTCAIPTDKVAAEKFSVAPPFSASAVLSGGVYTSGARASATYTWAGSNGVWSDAANWRIGGEHTGVWPTVAKTYSDQDAVADSATFGTSAAVTLTETAKIATLTVAGDSRVAFASDAVGTLRDLQVLEYVTNASPTLAFASVNLFPLQNQSEARTLAVGGTVEIVDGTTNGLYATSWRISDKNKPCSNFELTGSLTGSGALTVGSNTSYSRGYFYFKGDNSAFSGTVLATHKSTDAVYWENGDAGSSNAAWNLGQYDNKSLKIRSGSGTTNRFGRLVCNGVALENTYGAILEIGALGGESTLDLASGAFDVVKVGSGNLTIDGNKTGHVTINAGTVTIGSAEATLVSQNRAITFAGGALVNAYGTDVSPYIANSAETAAAIAIDDQGTDATWATALPAAVKGGLVKRGAGTLSIVKGQTIAGALQVEGGKIGFTTGITGEAETLMTWDAGGAKEVTVADFAVATPAAPLGLVIVTNDTKVSLVVERTAQTYTYVGGDYGLWDNVSNWKMGDVVATVAPNADDAVIINDGLKVVITTNRTAFGSLTLNDGAKLAISFSGDAQTYALPEGRAEGDFVTSGPFTMAFSDGTFTATRVASTFTWTGAAADGLWETLGNWTVNGQPTYAAMNRTDTALFTTAATVTLGDNPEVTNLTIRANVTINGGENTHCVQQLNEVVTENGAILTLNNARLQSRDIYNDPATWTADIAIVGDCQFRAYTAQDDGLNKLYYYGKLSGSGNLTCTECQNRHVSRAGVVLYGDNSAFSGTITMTAGNTGAGATSSRTPGFIGAVQALSSNAVWNIVGNNNDQDSLTDIRNFKGTADNYTKLYFGALNGTWYAKVSKSGDWYSFFEEFVIGGANVDCTFNPIFSRSGSGDADRPDSYLAIRKVGSAELSIAGEDSGTSVYRYTIESGTLKLNGKYSLSTYAKTGPYLAFEGGDLRIGYYEASSNVVTVISEEPYETETNVVNYIARLDPSEWIKNSTGAISFDDQGTNHTWAAALAASNVGGLTKKGTGTLTLAKAPKYAGVTTVEAGTLVVPDGTEVALNAMSAGTLEGGEITNAVFAAGTVATEVITDPAQTTIRAFECPVDYSNVTVDLTAKSDWTANATYYVTVSGSIVAGTGLNRRSCKLILPGAQQGRWAFRVIELPGHGKVLAVRRRTGVVFSLR